MKVAKRLLLFLSSMVFLVQCSPQQTPVTESPVTPKKISKAPRSEPRPCPTCQGTGFVTSSIEAPLEFSITRCSVSNKAFPLFSPDYYAEIGIENRSDVGGIFKVFADFEYKGIGMHREEGEIYVPAHAVATKTLHYAAQRIADHTACAALAPVGIQTKKSICPTCKGKGLIP